MSAFVSQVICKLPTTLVLSESG